MGLGKTVTTLTAIRQLMYDRFQVRKVLVIAPKKVAEGTWTTGKGQVGAHEDPAGIPGTGKPGQKDPGTKHTGGHLHHQPGKRVLAGGLLPEQLAV